MIHDDHDYNRESDHAETSARRQQIVFVRAGSTATRHARRVAQSRVDRSASVYFDDVPRLLGPTLAGVSRSVFNFPALGLRSVREFNFRTLL